MTERETCLRLHFPLWQGGNNPAYYFGASLLAWLAPQNTTDVIETVNVTEPLDETNCSSLEKVEGIVGKHEIQQQLSKARYIIEQHSPEKIVTLGGDCLVDLVEFAHLCEKYGDELGILWIDTHPDVMTSKEFQHAHAMVLSALMGKNDEWLVDYVKKPIASNRVMIAGLNNETEYEKQFIKDNSLRVYRPEDIKTKLGLIKKWIAEEKIKYLAIHIDLDVLSTMHFKSLLFSNPNVPLNHYDGIAQGLLSLEDVSGLIEEASENSKVVGLGITEFLPWDCLNLRNMLAKFPLFNNNK
ncbi:predicted protein [Naegleria gruberi]|uniref:Predicted protein n=1 Tax=Naegleria gruberi TaxID=5762 RepID=D2VK47_NAEGR|nr:uncharacterized protein NAEGRDRAFT_50209 [Naegleria gruberi]EFC42800.1 predicted protein [Naegleria gruberi]|eukprot:XP_002675544.1 predicted protein [Naegleria gruberi strain NEG-M]